MSKSDYDIDISASRAFMVDELRWKRARSRKPTFVSIYDLRYDEKQLAMLSNYIAREGLLDRLRANTGDLSWAAYLDGDPRSPRTFLGYVGRVLEPKGKGYYVEIPRLKTSRFARYDPEPRLFSVSGLKPNVPGSELRFRYLYEPFPAGRILRILYLSVKRQETLDDFSRQLVLELQVERDFAPEAYAQLVGELSEAQRERRMRLYRKVSIGPG